MGFNNNESECIIGAITPLFSTIIPKGWILFDDTPLDKTLYSRLWNAVKDMPHIEMFDEWGNPMGMMPPVEDMGTEFILPNAQGRVLIGAGERMDIVGISQRPLGATGGRETLPTNDLPDGEMTVGAINTGGGKPNNNMQPFIAINYIIYTGVMV